MMYLAYVTLQHDFPWYDSKLPIPNQISLNMLM
jgi:hypothetical protein